MTDDAEIAADRRHRDLLEALGELRQALARMEALMRQIALGMGMKPDG